jgi:hypothetical protein
MSHLAEAWTNLSEQDKTWVEFSTLEVTECLLHAV